MKLKLFEFKGDAFNDVIVYVLSRDYDLTNNDCEITALDCEITTLDYACHILEKDCKEFYEVSTPDKPMDIESGNGKTVYDQMLSNRWQIMRECEKEHSITYWYAYDEDLWNDVDNVPPMNDEEKKNREYINSL